MNCFDNVTIKNGEITVLGASADSAFVKSLCEFLKASGRADIKVNAPDTDGFRMHTEQEISAMAENGQIIGVINIDIYEKRICDVLKNYDRFCEISDLASDELIFPKSVANAVRCEKYDVLFIDGVNSPDKRFLARETAKILKSGVDVYMINTDSDFVETLIKQN